MVSAVSWVSMSWWMGVFVGGGELVGGPVDGAVGVA